MWKTQLMEYKEYIFLPSLSGSGYLSPIPEIQGGADPPAGPGWEGPCPLGWDGMGWDDPGTLLVPSPWQNSHQHPIVSFEKEVVWGPSNQD